MAGAVVGDVEFEDALGVPLGPGGGTDDLAAEGGLAFQGGDLEAVGAALDLPDSYKQTFDALAACLADVDSNGHHGTVLLWDGWGPLAREDEQAFNVALSVLGTRVNAERGSPFAVLLRGEGPDPAGVPELA
jgi:hypothetical protein